MGQDTDTIPPDQRVVRIAIIDANDTFSEELTRILRKEFAGLVQIEGFYEETPPPEAVEHCVDVVLFDPELDEFRELEEALQNMERTFGDPVAFVAHTDAWKQEGGRLREELLAAGVRRGLKRMDFAGLVLLMRLITEGHSAEAISKLFSI